MPKLLSSIESMTIHPSDSGVSTVSVWFTEGRHHQERVTFTPFDLFDYRLFSARVLESTGHPFACTEVEQAPDAWRAEVEWRRVVSEKLEAAAVEPQGRYHWRALTS
jgi:hypothetical protein